MVEQPKRERERDGNYLCEFYYDVDSQEYANYDHELWPDELLKLLQAFCWICAKSKEQVGVVHYL